MLSQVNSYLPISDSVLLFVLPLIVFHNEMKFAYSPFYQISHHALVNWVALYEFNF